MTKTIDTDFTRIPKQIKCYHRCLNPFKLQSRVNNVSNTKKNMHNVYDIYDVYVWYIAKKNSSQCPSVVYYECSYSTLG